MNKAIEVKGLSHYFGQNRVIDNISFTVEEGNIFGLLGPSGAGKTTLINILTGQLKASEGESRIFNIESRHMKGKDYKQIGIMIDNFGLYERMSCYDNLRFYQMLDGNQDKNIEAVLKSVGLLNAKRTQVMNLSKGMTNRLAFARAILRKPRILFPRAMSQSHACMTLTNAARVNTPPLGALQFPCLAACGGVIDFWMSRPAVWTRLRQKKSIK